MTETDTPLCLQDDGRYEIVDNFVIDEWLDEKITVGTLLSHLRVLF